AGIQSVSEMRKSKIARRRRVGPSVSGPRTMLPTCPSTAGVSTADAPCWAASPLKANAPGSPANVSVVNSKASQASSVPLLLQSLTCEVQPSTRRSPSQSWEAFALPIGAAQQMIGPQRVADPMNAPSQALSIATVQFTPSQQAPGSATLIHMTAS